MFVLSQRLERREHGTRGRWRSCVLQAPFLCSMAPAPCPSRANSLQLARNLQFSSGLEEYLGLNGRKQWQVSGAELLLEPCTLTVKPTQTRVLGAYSIG